MEASETVSRHQLKYERQRSCEKNPCCLYGALSLLVKIVEITVFRLIYNTAWLIERHGHRTPREVYLAATSKAAA